MRSAYLLAACSLFSIAAPAMAQRPYKPDAAVERFVQVHDVRPDGSDTESTEYVFRVETPQGISDVGALRIGFRSDLDDVESVEAWTVRADGTTVTIPADSIRTQDEGTDGGTSEFTNMKYKVLVYPSVEVGSRVGYRARINHRSTPFPGLFNDAYAISPAFNYEHWEVRVNIPAGLPLYVQQRVIPGGLESSADGVNHYRFTYQWLAARAPEPGSVSDHDFAPALSISTYPDLIALGAAYEKAAAPMAEVTAAIRDQALKITDGLADDTARARSLHHWVAKNIRYVAVYLGHGGLIPHSADHVLANRYGDCKDHAILLQSLLSAAGIESSTALVSAGSAYQLPTVGAISPLNHAITYIPSLDLYLDSTDQFAPFGTLPSSDMDKPTVLTALGRMGRTPTMRADRNVQSSAIKLQIRADGSIDGTARTTVNGVMEGEVRAARFYAQSLPEPQVVKEMLRRFNETGTGSLVHEDPNALDKPFWIDAKFQLDPVTNFPGPGALIPPVGLAPGAIASMAASSPLPTRERDYVCWSRTLDETYRVEFPPGTTLGPLPKGLAYDQDGVRYTSTYSAHGLAVDIRRRIEIQRVGNVCTPQTNASWRTFHRMLQRDLRSQIFYR